MNKPYYTECPDCGAHLDPGESCDCVAKPTEYISERYVVGVDISAGNDLSCVGVYRIADSKTTVIKMTYGKEAEELYTKLTGISV